MKSLRMGNYKQLSNYPKWDRLISYYERYDHIKRSVKAFPDHGDLNWCLFAWQRI